MEPHAGDLGHEPRSRAGRPSLLLLAVGAGLLLAGVFALGAAATGRFLPHDEEFLGMSAAELCEMHGCRIVHFMIHDRVAFGGTLIAVGLLYLWITLVPLARGEAWAWWLLVLSGSVGFLSFFAYLGFGYLDTWHGLATLALFPCYLLGLSQARPAGGGGIGSLLGPVPEVSWTSRAGLGRACLLFVAFGLTAGGLTIIAIGMTSVFVPQDLDFLGVSRAEMRSLNPRLVPLIAHDRAGFGGCGCCAGLTLFFCIWRAAPSRSLWNVLAAYGIVLFGTAIGIHPLIGYNDALHLAPAVLGAAVFLVGLVLTPREANSTAPSWSS